MSYKETPPETPPVYQKFPKGLERFEEMTNQIALSIYQMRIYMLHAASAAQKSESTR